MLSPELVMQLQAAGKNRDAGEIQKLLDPAAMFLVSLNPEVRVKVARKKRR